MCGIACIFSIAQQTAELRKKALRMSQKIRHRGPDWSGIYCGGSAILAHERLSIVDPESGRQPLFAPDKKQVLAVNGEIYNHQNIRARFADTYQFQTGSDCEVILSLYREMRADTDFATLIYQGEDAVHSRICQMLEQLAFFACIFPADLSVAVRLLAVAWLGSAVTRCRKAMKK